jgi:hypothetical protein
MLPHGRVHASLTAGHSIRVGICTCQHALLTLVQPPRPMSSRAAQCLVAHTIACLYHFLPLPHARAPAARRSCQRLQKAADTRSQTVEQSHRRPGTPRVGSCQGRRRTDSVASGYTNWREPQLDDSETRFSVPHMQSW